MDPDFELLQRALSGDRQAWSELVKRHCPAVYRFFRAIAPRDAVGELTQETFARIEQAFSAEKEMTHFRAFLFGIARHVFHEYVRASARTDILVEDMTGDAEQERAEVRHLLLGRERLLDPCERLLRELADRIARRYGAEEPVHRRAVPLHELRPGLSIAGKSPLEKLEVGVHCRRRA